MLRTYTAPPRPAPLSLVPNPKADLTDFIRRNGGRPHLTVRMFQVSQAWQARAGTGAGASPLARLIEQVAIHFYGKPNAAMSSKTELRFHAKGSLSVDLTKATFYDHEIGEGGGLVDMVKRETGRAGADAFEWCREQGYDVPDDRTNGTGGGKPHIVATYPYTDASGELRFEVCRYEPKTFKQRQPDGHGGYVWSVKGVKQIPFRLPELVEAIGSGRTVYVVEGEKDVLRLATLGLTATCNAGGAGKWKAELNEHFRGADVVIVGDNDDAGRKPGARWVQARGGHNHRGAERAGRGGP
jgi:hypothetical protein